MLWSRLNLFIYIDSSYSMIYVLICLTLYLNGVPFIFLRECAIYIYLRHSTICPLLHNGTKIILCLLCIHFNVHTMLLNFCFTCKTFIHSLSMSPLLCPITFLFKLLPPLFSLIILLNVSSRLSFLSINIYSFIYNSIHFFTRGANVCFSCAILWSTPNLLSPNHWLIFALFDSASIFDR